MTQRVRERDDMGSLHNSHAPRRRRPSLRPRAEALEGRSLLSTAGGPDFTYGVSAATVSTGGPELDTQGLAQVNFEPGNSATASYTTGEAIQSDGKVVVAGYVYSYGGATTSDSSALTRLNTDGSVDTTFGFNGVVFLPATAGYNTASAVAIQSNGDIVVAANLSAGSFANSAVGIYRLTPNGTIDTTFGTGGSTDFSFKVGTTSVFSEVTTLVIAPDGDIVVGGYGNNSPNGFLPALARLTPDGSVDTTFGTSGQALPTFTNADPPQSSILSSQLGVDGLAVLADNSIVFDTSVLPSGSTSANVGLIAVGKLTPTGTFDTTFGTGGQVLLGGTDGAGRLAVQANGQLIVTGTDQTLGSSGETIHFDLYRLNTDGSVDTTFGTMGEATPGNITFPTGGGGGYDALGSVLVESNGTILLGAVAAVNDPANYQEGPTDERAIFALNVDGSPDIQFGSDGVTTLPSEWFRTSPPLGLALQSDGKILVASDVGIGRLLATGSSNDFDDDGTTDPAVLLPNGTPYPVFAYRPSTGGADVLNYFGTPGDSNTLPAPGAYDGSGIDEEAVYLPTIGAFGIRPYGSDGPQDKLVYIGQKGAGNSIPAPADYAGLGYTQVGVFEPATASFVYSPANSSAASTDVTIPFGTPGVGNSIPVPADYDGSGQDELGVYLPAIGAFAYRPAGTTGNDDQFVFFGTPGAGNSIPVPGDYDGSGHTEIAVYLPAIGAFAYRPYGTTGSQDTFVFFGIAGAGNSIPMPGDYDGSGHTEFAVYMPSLDAIAYRPYGTTGQDDKFIFFGQPGAGNTVPFNAEGAAYIESESNGGGGGGGLAIRPNVASWVDFVPTPAGQAKKGQGGAASSAPAIGGQS